MTIRLTDKVFNDKYKDAESAEFQKLSNELINSVSGRISKALSVSDTVPATLKLFKKQILFFFKSAKHYEKYNEGAGRTGLEPVALGLSTQN